MRARIHVFPQLHARGIITFITKHQHCNVTGSSTASGHVVATVQVPENAAENLRKSYVTAYTFQFHGTMFSFLSSSVLFYPITKVYQVRGIFAGIAFETDASHSVYFSSFFSPRPSSFILEFPSSCFLYPKDVTQNVPSTNSCHYVISFFFRYPQILQ